MLQKPRQQRVLRERKSQLRRRQRERERLTTSEARSTPTLETKIKIAMPVLEWRRRRMTEWVKCCRSR